VTIDPFDLAILAWAFGFGLLSMWLARLRERSPVAWAIYGAILGPLAVILLAVSPPGRCVACRAPVRGWPKVCPWCGSDVRRGGPPVAAPAAAVAAGAGTRGGSLLTVTPTVSPTVGVVGVTAAPAADAAAPAVSNAAPTSVTGAAPTGAVATPSRAQAAAAPTAGAPAAETVTLASGIFLTGTVGLLAGSRYAIETDGRDLRVISVGEPGRKVAFERRLTGISASGIDDRLVLATTGRNGTVLVFLAADAGGSGASAAAIMRAVDAAGRGA
jgi:hypothetical protein